MKFFSVFLISLLVLLNCRATTWQVGASQTYTFPGQIKNLVGNGDTILIDGGIYINDAVKWTKKNLVFIGLGTGTNRTILKHTGNINNNKGIFVFESPGTSDNAYIENIVFDGAQVSNSAGGNGAGIRFQARNLTINKCKFMNCQNGILEGNGSVTSSNVTIENSEFENNGYQQPNNPNFSGYEHHVYINGSTDSLMIRNCYFHNPRGQANSIKTRAQKCFILYNLIDEANGYGSWEINIAQGGLNVIMGNIIIQGTTGANHGIVGYDAATNSLQDFYFINNTVINKYNGNIRYFNTTPSSGINTYKIYNNIFASVNGANNTNFSGNTPAVLDTSNNLFANNYLNIGFQNPALNDYSLSANAMQIRDQGINAGSTNTTFSLTPIYMYDDFISALLSRSTSGTSIDLGAYEFASNVSTNDIHLNNSVLVYPNPSNCLFTISIRERLPLNPIRMEIYTMQGQILFAENVLEKSFTVDLSHQKPGIYFLRMTSEGGTSTKKIILN